MGQAPGQEVLREEVLLLDRIWLIRAAGILLSDPWMDVNLTFHTSLLSARRHIRAEGKIKAVF